MGYSSEGSNLFKANVLLYCLLLKIMNSVSYSDSTKVQITDKSHLQVPSKLMKKFK